MTQMFHLQVSLPCTPAQAFRSFIDETQLERWLTEKAQVEAWIDGLYELFWAPDDPENDSTIGCRITAFEPEKLIAFDWRSPRQYKSFANSADPLTHVVVFFRPQGAVTEVHVIHSGWRATPEWQEAREWQCRAWTMALEALKKEFQNS